MSYDQHFHFLANEAADPGTSSARLAELASIPSLRMLVSANPATPAELLEELAQYKDSRIRAAVASNPNTPFSALQRLIWEFPREFIENPIFPLFVLTQPDFIKELYTPPAFWPLLLRSEEIPPLWLQWLRDGVLNSLLPLETLLEEVKMHVAYAGEVTPHWEASIHEALARGLQPLKNTSGRFAALRQRNGSTLGTKKQRELLVTFLLTRAEPALQNGRAFLRFLPREIARLALTYCQTLDVEVLQTFMHEPDAEIYQLVALHPHTPFALLQALAQKLPHDVRLKRMLASHAEAPAGLLERLAHDRDASVRSEVARHAQLPPALLPPLAHDPAQRVRVAIASSPALNDELQWLLAHDPELEVRQALAQNIQLDNELFPFLARDVPEVRAALARNPKLPLELMLNILTAAPALHGQLARNAHLPIEIIQALVAHAEPTICVELARNPVTPYVLLEEWVRSENIEMQIALAQNPAATPDLLAQVGSKPSAKRELLVPLASHPHSPPALLEKLALGRDPLVMHALAANPHTPEIVLEQLFTYGDLELRKKLVRNPSFDAISADFFYHQFLSTLHEQLTEELFTYQRESSWLPSGGLRLLLLADPHLPEELLTLLATSPHWEERLLVARHPNTTPPLLETLTHDGNRYIRATAHQQRFKRGFNSEDSGNTQYF